jgi:hypothetical protein
MSEAVPDRGLFREVLTVLLTFCSLAPVVPWLVGSSCCGPRTGGGPG